MPDFFLLLVLHRAHPLQRSCPIQEKAPYSETSSTSFESGRAGGGCPLPYQIFAQKILDNPRKKVYCSERKILSNLSEGP